MNSRFIEIRKQIGKFIANFSVTEEDGKEYIFDGEIIREGLEISTYDEQGDIIPLPDGEYTIQGVSVIVVDGKVSELPEKESKVEEPSEPLDFSVENEALKAENETLKAENEALKVELEELKKKPLAKPVPQRTDMSSEKSEEILDRVKGTKYEKAVRILNS